MIRRKGGSCESAMFRHRDVVALLQRRGQLRLMSNAARLMAFVMECLAAVQYVRSLAQDLLAQAVPCILVQSAPDSLESFWALHKRGEEVIATRRADPRQQRSREVMHTSFLMPPRKATTCACAWQSACCRNSLSLFA